MFAPLRLVALLLPRRLLHVHNLALECVVLGTCSCHQNLLVCMRRRKLVYNSIIDERIRECRWLDEPRIVVERGLATRMVGYTHNDPRSSLQERDGLWCRLRSAVLAVQRAHTVGVAAVWSAERRRWLNIRRHRATINTNGLTKRNSLTRATMKGV